MTRTLFLQNVWYCHISILHRFASVGRFIFGLFSSLLFSLMSQRASLFSLRSPPSFLHLSFCHVLSLSIFLSDIMNIQPDCRGTWRCLSGSIRRNILDWKASSFQSCCHRWFFGSNEQKDIYTHLLTHNSPLLRYTRLNHGWSSSIIKSPRKIREILTERLKDNKIYRFSLCFI